MAPMIYTIGDYDYFMTTDEYLYAIRRVPDRHALTKEQILELKVEMVIGWSIVFAFAIFDVLFIYFIVWLSIFLSAGSVIK